MQDLLSIRQIPYLQHKYLIANTVEKERIRRVVWKALHFLLSYGSSTAKTFLTVNHHNLLHWSAAFSLHFETRNLIHLQSFLIFFSVAARYFLLELLPVPYVTECWNWVILFIFHVFLWLFQITYKILSSCLWIWLESYRNCSHKLSHCWL